MSGHPAAPAHRGAGKVAPFLRQNGRLIACLVVLASPVLHPSANASDLAGVEAYRKGDFAGAAIEFGNAARKRPASGTLLNLGLAEWQLGHRGPALLAWEQSLWVDPFNKAARQNLQFARRTAQLDAPEYAWHEAASMWLPVNAWAWVAGGSLWFAVAMALLPRVLRWRRANWHQALAAVGCAVFLLCLPSLHGVHTRSKMGIVLGKETPLRLTPTSNAQTIVLLPEGQPARWERVRGDYLFIRTSYGKGWIERTQFGSICPE